MFDPGELAEFGGKLASVDVRMCADADLEGAVRGLAALRSLIEQTEAHVLAELDARGTTDRDHGMRTVAWVAAATGGDRGPITGRLRVGRALRNRFDRVDDALTQGRLTFDHARTLANASNPRILDAFTASQDEIITLAEASTFPQWKRDLMALAEHADEDGPKPDPFADNELHLPRTLDGRTEIGGSFDAALGLAIRTAIEAKADEMFRRFTADHNLTHDLTVPARKVLRALALGELVRIATGVEPGTGVAPRAEVTLVLHDHEVCDADGALLPQADVDVWGCDPEVWAVVMNQMGIPVDVGHTRRLATIAQRRAIALRDGGCTFPGCDAPINWCDHHHVIDWQHGGATDLANLVAVCRHHHGVTHRHGWSLRLDDEQIPHWTTPSGEHLVGKRHPRTRRQNVSPNRLRRRPAQSPPTEQSQAHVARC